MRVSYAFIVLKKKINIEKQINKHTNESGIPVSGAQRIFHQGILKSGSDLCLLAFKRRMSRRNTNKKSRCLFGLITHHSQTFSSIDIRSYSTRCRTNSCQYGLFLFIFIEWFV